MIKFLAGWLRPQSRWKDCRGKAKVIHSIRMPRPNASLVGAHRIVSERSHINVTRDYVHSACRHREVGTSTSQKVTRISGRTHRVRNSRWRKGKIFAPKEIWAAGACGHIAVPWDRSPEKVPRGAVVKWNFEVRTGELKGVGDVPREPLECSTGPVRVAESPHREETTVHELKINMGLQSFSEDLEL